MRQSPQQLPITLEKAHNTRGARDERLGGYHRRHVLALPAECIPDAVLEKGILPRPIKNAFNHISGAEEKIALLQDVARNLLLRRHRVLIVPLERLERILFPIWIDQEQ